MAIWYRQVKLIGGKRNGEMWDFGRDLEISRGFYFRVPNFPERPPICGAEFQAIKDETFTCDEYIIEGVRSPSGASTYYAREVCVPPEEAFLGWKRGRL